ncbi:hypothetical protein RHS02_07596, partial [Rhizoctonia solani]
MSDSDAGGSVRGGDNNGYTSEGGGYSSEAGAGYDGGVSSDAPPDPDVEMSDTDDELWDEMFRPVERDDGASEHVGSVLGQMELGLRMGLGNRLGEPQMDFDSLTSLLDMLGSHGMPYSEASGTDGEVDVGRLDQQTLDLARAEVDLANVGLDFSWVDSMSQGGQGIGMQGLMRRRRSRTDDGDGFWDKHGWNCAGQSRWAIGGEERRRLGTTTSRIRVVLDLRFSLISGYGWTRMCVMIYIVILVGMSCSGHGMYF